MIVIKQLERENGMKYVVDGEVVGGPSLSKQHGGGDATTSVRNRKER